MGAFEALQSGLGKLLKRTGDGAPTDRRILEIGWLLDTDKAGFIWEAPRQFRRTDPAPKHAKAVNYCPAVLDYEARTFEVTCPIDLQMRFRYGEKGEPGLINSAGDMSPIRSKHLGQMVSVVARKEWRHPDRPIIQIITPYTFIADEPVWINQMPAYMHFRDPPLPGLLIGGRFPLHLWPRQMMWAFEWYDIEKELKLSRGEPWFTIRFETPDPTRPIRMVEAEMTTELREYIKGMAGVTNYVKRTFSLFDTAERRRPQRLLTRKQR